MVRITDEQIFSTGSILQFESIALEIFRYQAVASSVYGEFIQGLNINPESVRRLEDIPFLPIEFFKSHKISCSGDEAEIVFTSSGTGGIQSRHFVSDLSVYERSFRDAFNLFYGDIARYAVIALLPSYLEREGSSLIYMVDDLIRKSKNPESGFFLNNHADLFQSLQNLKRTKTPALLIGVTYALLDFIENHALDFPELIVIETGGMKGKRQEIIREELHEMLCRGFGVNTIHSEYGMTELLSQAYSKGSGRFYCPPWMRVFIRDINDPFTLLKAGYTGGINVIDFANINSCAFIATQDIGKLNTDGSFEVLGRYDNSDIRGCNLMVG